MRRVFQCLVVACLALVGAGQARADERQDLVDRARWSVDSLRREANFGPNIDRLLPRARAVLIFPSLYRGGLIIGAEGGTGVMLSRSRNGDWSAPAFVTMGSGSFGLQVGFQSAEAMFIVMSDAALNKLLRNQFKFGADASVAVGPMGGGVEASSTTNLNADVYAYSRAAGLFGGGAIEGSMVQPREDWNRRYYGDGADLRAIVTDHRFDSYAGARDLRQALGQTIKHAPQPPSRPAPKK